MKKIWITVLASMLVLAGCGHEGGSGVAIIDLSAIAAATGQDAVIRQKAEAGRNDLMMQLQQVAATLDEQLAAEREKMGDSLSAEEEQTLQQMNTQARNTLQEAQQQAQRQANQMEQTLVADFRDEVKPLAEEIARSRGASAVLAVDAYLFWFEPEADITDEVIAAWRAQEGDAAATAKEKADEVQEMQEELEAVEQELEAVEGVNEEQIEQQSEEAAE